MAPFAMEPKRGRRVPALALPTAASAVTTLALRRARVLDKALPTAQDIARGALNTLRAAALRDYPRSGKSRWWLAGPRLLILFTLRTLMFSLIGEKSPDN